MGITKERKKVSCYVLKNRKGKVSMEGKIRRGRNHV